MLRKVGRSIKLAAQEAHVDMALQVAHKIFYSGSPKAILAL